MTTTTEDVYVTADLQEITYLILRRVPLLGASPDTTGRVWFTFKGSDHCRNLILDLGTGQDTVSLSAAFSAIKNARRIMHTV